MRSGQESLAHNLHCSSSQMCLMGLSSGLHVGQSGSSTPNLCNHVFMELALYIGCSTMCENDFLNYCTKSVLFIYFVHALDRRMVSAHLPLAWTHSSQLEDEKFMSVMDEIAKGFQTH